MVDRQEDHVLPAWLEASSMVVDSAIGRRATSVTGEAVMAELGVDGDPMHWIAACSRHFRKITACDCGACYF